MSARILPFATRVRRRTVIQRRIERTSLQLSVQTDGTALTITAQDISEPEPISSDDREDFRPNFRD